MSRPRPWLAPAGAIYLLLARAWHGSWDRGWRRPGGAGVPVISVGNLLAGGTGKTPAVAWLARRLTERGHAVGIVSRGYGGRRDRDPLLVARHGALLADARAAGDEPLLLAASTPAAAVAVGRRRVDAARLAVDAGARIVLLDDGFQHRALARDCDLVLLDGRAPLGSGRGLPAGLLREPPSALARADVLLLTRSPAALLAAPQPLPRSAWPARLGDALPADADLPVFASEHVPDALRLPDGTRSEPRALDGRRVVAVSGIARPDAFERTLGALGARIAAHVAFPDHHRFSAAELAAAEARRRAVDAELLVTTAKDAVRWPADAPRPAILDVVLRVPAAEAFLDAILARARIAERAGP